MEPTSSLRHRLTAFGISLFARGIPPLLVLWGAGCGSSGGTGPRTDMTAHPDLATALDLATPPDLRVANGYPAGPYGHQIGSVLQNLSVQGYYSPTETSALASTRPFGEVSFDRIRTSGASHMLLFLAGFN